VTTSVIHEPAESDEAPKKKRLVSPRPLARLLPRLKPYRGALAIATVCLILSSAAGLAFPRVVQYLLDAAFVRGDRRVLDRIALGLFALFAAQAVLNFIQVYFLSATGERVIAGLRKELFAHLVRLSPGFFAERQSGELPDRAQTEAAQPLVLVGCERQMVDREGGEERRRVARFDDLQSRHDVPRRRGRRGISTVAASTGAR